jgi:hypothetical protein
VYTRTPYIRNVWVDVADPEVPPVGAIEINAVNLGKMEDGIKFTRDSLQSAIVELVDDELSQYDAYSLFPSSASSFMRVTDAKWGFDGQVMQLHGDPAHQIHFFSGGLRIRRALSPARTNWSPSTNLSLNALIQPLTANGKYYRVTTQGMTAATEPTWNPTGTTTSGSVTFTYEGDFWGSWGSYILSNDSRLTDSRDPNAHVETHHTGGSDQLTSQDIGAVRQSAPTMVGPLVHTPQVVQTLIATDTIAVNRFIVQIDSDAVITLANAVAIQSGVAGQIIRLVNVGAYNITLPHVGSNLNLPAGAVILGPFQSIDLTYLTENGKWNQSTQKVG